MRRLEILSGQILTWLAAAAVVAVLLGPLGGWGDDDDELGKSGPSINGLKDREELELLREE